MLVGEAFWVSVWVAVDTVPVGVIEGVASWTVMVIVGVRVEVPAGGRFL